jgi:hypothetical protein
MNLLVLGPTSRSSPATPIGLGCQRCGLLDVCGGVTDFDCLGGCCSQHAACRLACPCAERWVEAVRDGGGIEMQPRYEIGQGKDDLPEYVPHVLHGSGRSQRFSCGYVALTTFDVTAPESPTSFSGPSDLRRYFGVADDARILLLSVGKDNRLEHHWRYSASHHLAEYLAALGISHITAPNFSMAHNDPRPEHLVNRSRSLREAERFTAAGLSVVPHLNAVTQKDWDCWRDFLKDHPHLSINAQEFQTGLAVRNKARWHIWQLMNIEQALGRGFRLLAIGGRRHLPLLVGLKAVTIADVNPFIKTQMRQKLVDGRWVKHATPEGEPLDGLLAENVAAYTLHVRSRVAAMRKIGPLLPSYEPVGQNGAASVVPVSELQMVLPWPASQNASRTL